MISKNPMDIRPEPLFLSDYKPSRDARGSFQKIFRTDHLEKRGLDLRFRESFVSFSEPGVLRGMHFQLPPADHWKLVACIAGSILDVCVDLRKGPTYGKAHAWTLTEEAGGAVLIPPGFGHGFLAGPAKAAGVLYLTTSEHDPARDTGVRWDTIGFAWPTSTPLLSDRDRGFVSLEDFKSPF